MAEDQSEKFDEKFKEKEVIFAPKPCPYFYQVINGKKVYPHREETDGNKNEQS